MERLRAVRVELREGHAVGEQRVQERRDPTARDGAAEEAPVEGLDEQEQHVGPPGER